MVFLSLCHERKIFCNNIGCKNYKKYTYVQLLTAANWDPSGNNMQPWRFSVVMNNKELLKKLSSLIVYHNWVENAPCLIAVFLDTKSLDDKVPSIYLKHAQSIGAAIQNLLLAAYVITVRYCKR